MNNDELCEKVKASMTRKFVERSEMIAEQFNQLDDDFGDIYLDEIRDLKDNGYDEDIVVEIMEILEQEESSSVCLEEQIGYTDQIDDYNIGLTDEDIIQGLGIQDLQEFETQRGVQLRQYITLARERRAIETNSSEDIVPRGEELACVIAFEKGVVMRSRIQEIDSTILNSQEFSEYLSNEIGQDIILDSDDIHRCLKIYLSEKNTNYINEHPGFSRIKNSVTLDEYISKITSREPISKTDIRGIANNPAVARENSNTEEIIDKLNDRTMEQDDRIK